MSIGRFVWHDHLSPDPKAAVGFYTALFGWRAVRTEQTPRGPYVQFSDGLQEAGGFMVAPEGQAASGWVPYVSVERCDAALGRLRELGGRVHIGPIDVPAVGAFASIRDDQGAELSIIELRDEPTEYQRPPLRGEFGWHGLVTDKPDAALAFYTVLFGWRPRPADAGPLSGVFARGGVPVAGIVSPSGDAPPPFRWRSSIAVDDIDAALTRALELGGSMLEPVHDVDGLGQHCLIADPLGAVLGLVQGRR